MMHPGFPMPPDEEEPKPPNRWTKFFDAWAWTGLIVFSALLLMMAGDAVNINSHLMPQKAKADTVSDKYDGDCTGHETVGRCADKCPPPSFVRGFDKDTGAAVCGRVTGCPYGDSIPLGPQCEKAGADQQAAQTTPVNTDPSTSLTDTCGVAK